MSDSQKQSNLKSLLDQAPSGSLSHSVLRSISADHVEDIGTSRGNHDDHEDDSHIEHPDERWLVSYADMMTLLFGLFVMLYSMRSDFKGAQNSIDKAFSKAPAESAEPPPQVVSADAVKAMQEALEKSKKDLESLATKVAQSEAALQARQAEIAELSQKAQVSAAETERMKNELEQEKLKLAAVQEKAQEKTREKKSVENAQKLEEKIAALVARKKSLEQEIAASAAEQKKLKAAEPSAKNEIASLQAQVAAAVKLKEQINVREREIIELKEQLAKSEHDKQLRKNFMAYVLNWSTKDHDIDLIIEDPNGKKFDFKNRKYSDHPGTLALDTRRGPGTEVWQSDKILSGVYKVTYQFYNQYGNVEPALVQGTLFTPLGSVAIPAQKLDFTSKKTATIRFTVTEEGKVNLIDGQ